MKTVIGQSSFVNGKNPTQGLNQRRAARDMPRGKIFPLFQDGLGWSGWAVRGSAWRRTALHGERGCRCPDPVLFL